MKKTFILLLMLSVLGTMFSTEIYVRFKSNAALPQIQKGKKKITAKSLPLPSKLMSKYGVSSQARSMSFMSNNILQRTFKISIPDDVDVNIFLEELQLQDNVELVERVPEDYILTVPNDSFYGTISGYNLKWHLDLINAERAWDSVQGNPNIRVAVVDNAIWGEHEDLQIPPSLQYDIVNDAVGRAYPLDIEPNSRLANSLSHGTHCAGNVGAIKNNGIGIASLASGITLMGCGGWNLRNPNLVIGGYDGIVWAAENGARVISCSWGSNGTSAYTNTQAEIIRECYENGILVIVAAGNDNVSTISYPGGYRGAISVGSVDSDHKLSSFSNFGSWVDIAAPGGLDGRNSIFSSMFSYSKVSLIPTSPFFRVFYDFMAGTSMACPIVASLAGLMLSKDSTLTPAQIISLMQMTAQDRDSGLNINPYSGVIDAAAAINAVGANIKYGNPVSNFTVQRIFFDSIKVEWGRPKDTFALKGYVIYIDSVLFDSCYTGTFFYDNNLVGGKSVIRNYTVNPVYQDSSVLQINSDKFSVLSAIETFK